MITAGVLDMRRSLVGFSALFFLLSGAAASAGPFAWIHAWQSGQSVNTARAALAQNDRDKAFLALQRALQLNGNGPTGGGDGRFEFRVLLPAGGEVGVDHEDHLAPLRGESAPASALSRLQQPETSFQR